MNKFQCWCTKIQFSRIKIPKKRVAEYFFFVGLNGGIKELDYQVSGKIWRIKWRIKDGAWRIKWRIKPGFGGLNWRNETGAFRRISGFGCHGRTEKRNAGIFSFRMLFALQSYYEGRLQNVTTDTDNPDCPQVVTGTNDNSRSPETPSETHPETGTEPERGPAEGTLSELESRLSSIFGIVERNPGCNARFIADQFPSDTSVRTIERCIAELRKQGKIQYDGSKRFGGYRVVEQREDGRGASAS